MVGKICGTPPIIILLIIDMKRIFFSEIVEHFYSVDKISIYLYSIYLYIFCKRIQLLYFKFAVII
jgi:hypothetical protein